MIRKTLRIVGIGLLALVGLIAGVLLLVDPDKVVNAHKDDIAALVSETLGRPVKLGPVKSRLWPTLRAEISDIVLCRDATCTAAPQARVGRMVLRMSWIEALLSFGRRMHVTHFELEQVAINATRRPDGSWDFDEILDHLAAGPTVEPQEDEASLVDALDLDRAAIVDAEVVIEDQVKQRTLRIAPLSLVLNNVAFGEHLEIKLDAVLDDGTQKTPVNAQLVWGELRKDSPLEPLPDITARAEIKAFPFARWATLVPPDVLGPRDGTFTLFVDGTVREQGAVIKGEGRAATDGLVLAEGTRRGQATSGSVAFTVDIDQRAPRYDLSGLAVDIAGVQVTGGIHAKGTSLAQLDRADFNAKVKSLGAALAVLPPDTVVLPPELVADGPLAATLQSDGKTVKLTFEGDDARLGYGDAFDKPAGTPLRIDVKGTFDDAWLRVPAATVALGPVQAKGSFALPRKGNGPVEADVRTNQVALKSLRALSPLVDQALKKQRKVDGTFALNVDAKNESGRQRANVVAALSGVDVDLDGLRANGDADLKISVLPGDASTALTGYAHLTDLALQSRGENGDKVLDKKRGTPLSLDVDVVQKQNDATIRAAVLRIGGSTVEAKGTGTKLDQPDATVDIDLGEVKLAFDDLRHNLPGAGMLPPRGGLEGAVRIKGTPNDQKGLLVDAKNLTLRAGQSTIRGRATVRRLDAPVIDVALTDTTLRWADVRAIEPTLNQLPDDTTVRGDVTVVGDTQDLSTLDIAFDLPTVKVGRHTDVALKGTLVDLDKPKFALDLKGKSLDLDRLLPASDDDAKATDAQDENPDGLSPAARRTVRSLSGTGKVDLQKLVVSDQTIRDLEGSFVLDKGVLRFDQLGLTVFDGRVAAAGSSIDLGRARLGYDIQGTANGLRVEQLLRAATDSDGGVTGRIDNDIDLKGEGLSMKTLARSLLGRWEIKTDALAWEGLDVLGAVQGPLEQAFRAQQMFATFTGFAGGAKTTNQGRKKKAAPRSIDLGTALRDLQARLKFHGGKMTLQDPVDVATGFGRLHLTGGGDVDGRLDLDARAKLSDTVLGTALGGAIAGKGAEVPMKIKGTWKKPVITGVDVSSLVGALIGQDPGTLVKETVEQVKDTVQEGAQEVVNRGRDAARGAIDRGQAAADEAKAKAQDAAAKAQAEAQAKADAAKKAAEEQRKRAEEEAKKKAAAAKKAAEEKARKAAEKAKKEAEKRRKEAEEKAKKKAKELLGF